MSRTNGSGEKVRFNTEMPKRLRDDAKRNTAHGELAEEIRNLFRRIAYGEGASMENSEIERSRAELREVRHRIDTLRHERSKIDTEIEAQETRASRLEERVSELEKRRTRIDSTIEVVENMLLNGERMWPTRIKNAADVDPDTAQHIYQELRDRNEELPEEAFKEPKIHTPNDWREVEQ